MNAAEESRDGVGYSHHHRRRKEIFVNAAKLMSEEQLLTLGKQMEERKNSLKKAA
ncbi:hypothetical protein [Pseudomonas sp. FME51]|uniref:hypothetical protein n=1 Tax=Pseudomonas sp. FME51 TaxID=2742609 RepID=UPI001865B7D1|nr:hypothetical protein [Pseudomonas sp. FME51]